MPPPYSCTSVRELDVAGTTSTMSPSAVRCTRTERPSSSGRISTQNSSQAAACSQPRAMPDSAMRRAVMGDRQAPYGATCSGRGVVLFRLLRSVTMDTPSICGAGGAPPANGGGAAGLAARRASERALAAGASESWAHRPRGGRRLPGARVAAVLCAELGGASHLDLEGRGERRACDGGGIAPAHEPPRAARRPAPQLHRAAGVAAGRERYLEPAHEPAGGLGQADRRPIAHLHTAARRPLGRAGQR